MKCYGYLNVNSRGSVRFTKSRIGLNWDEIAIRLDMKIPDALFQRPTIAAKIEVSEDIIPKPQPFDIILKSKELIEESTGAKIEFTVKPYEIKND